MGVDLRQVVAGILTLTMFVMLGNMIKREHFDSSEEKFPGGRTDVEFDSGEVKLSEQGLGSFAKDGPWMEDGQELKPCWTKITLVTGTFYRDLSNSHKLSLSFHINAHTKTPMGTMDFCLHGLLADNVEQSKGFITFSLTNGPEYHVSQIADAVVIARYVGATIVIPDIRGNKPGDERKFEEIYDVEKFMQSLDGVVKVVKDLPDDLSIRDFAVIRVPNRVTEDHIAELVEPVYRSKGNIRLATYFSSVNMRKTAQKSNSDSIACMAMFGSLELQPEVNEVVDSMVERLRKLSHKSDGRFIAVDLRVEILEKKSCHGTGAGGAKNCYNAQEIALFLRKIGFDKDTTIYLTQSRWDDSLDVLKDIFPKTYTKERVMPGDKKRKFLESKDSEFEKAIDFYICTRSDVFVPAISGLFYANVAGKRIATGKTQILVPADIPGSSASITDHFSPYISKKNHLAYSCFC